MFIAVEQNYRIYNTQDDSTMDIGYVIQVYTSIVDLLGLTIVFDAMISPVWCCAAGGRWG